MIVLSISPLNPKLDLSCIRGQFPDYESTSRMSYGMCFLCWQHKKRASYGCSQMVPVAGLEPARYRYRWILSPLRLPIPSHRQNSALLLYANVIPLSNAFLLKQNRITCLFTKITIIHNDQNKPDRADP